MSEPTGCRGVQFVVGASRNLSKTTSLVKKKKQKTTKQKIHNGYSDNAVISLHFSMSQIKRVHIRFCSKQRRITISVSTTKFWNCNQGHKQFPRPCGQAKNFAYSLSIKFVTWDIRRLTRTKVRYLHYGQTKKKKKKKKKERKERKRKKKCPWLLKQFILDQRICIK